MFQLKKPPYWLLLVCFLAFFPAPSFAANQAKQYVGYWQVDRIRQTHKLPYYPRDCSAAKDIREIVEINGDKIKIKSGKKTNTYSVLTDSGQHYFQSTRRTPVIWEIDGDTFLHGVGVFWEAYRRCDSPTSSNDDRRAN